MTDTKRSLGGAEHPQGTGGPGSSPGVSAIKEYCCHCGDVVDVVLKRGLVCWFTYCTQCHRLVEIDYDDDQDDI